jgi:DNA polymerase-3 subunit delta
MAKPKAKPETKHNFVYVIAGQETSLVNAWCDKLLDQVIEPQQRATGLFNVDTAQVTATEILDELRTLPFLTDKRVVLIKDAEKFVSENRELLEKYFDKPCPTGILILTVKSWDARTRLAKKLPKIGELITVQPPKTSQLPAKLVEYARDAHGKKLDYNAARLLVDLAGDNLVQLYSELDKLALFANDQKSITPEHVESLTGNNRFFNAFAVIDSIITGNTAKAFDKVRVMFAEDKSSEYTVVGAFAFHFRRMFNAKVLLEKGVSASEITKKMRIWSNTDAFFAQLRKISLKKIGAILQRLADIDYEIKTGKTKAQVAIEKLILKLTAD